MKTVTFKAGALLAKGSFESLLIVSQWRGAQVGCRHPVARGISREVTLCKVTFQLGGSLRCPLFFCLNAGMSRVFGCIAFFPTLFRGLDFGENSRTLCGPMMRGVTLLPDFVASCQSRWHLCLDDTGQPLSTGATRRHLWAEAGDASVSPGRGVEKFS